MSLGESGKAEGGRHDCIPFHDATVYRVGKICTLKYMIQNEYQWIYEEIRYVYYIYEPLLQRDICLLYEKKSRMSIDIDRNDLPEDVNAMKDPKSKQINNQ